MVAASIVAHPRLPLVALAIVYSAYVAGCVTVYLALGGHGRDQGLEHSLGVLGVFCVHFAAVTSITLMTAACVHWGYRPAEILDRLFRSNWTPAWLARSQQRMGVLLIGSICMLSFGLYARSVFSPTLFEDDFAFLRVSQTWSEVRDHLWVFRAGQILPAARLTTLLIVQAADCATCISRALALHGPLFLLLVALLLYVFVTRELGRFYGLAAMAFFAVSTTYQESVWRFTASLALPATAMILAALIAAQGWRQKGRKRDLVACMLWCAIAPIWFASGVFAAPLCCLYLCAPQRPTDQLLDGWSFRRVAANAVPLLGASWFVIVSLQVARENQDAFDPLTGLVWTVRSVVDNLVPGFTGVSAFIGLRLPWPISFAAFLGLAAAAGWWWRRAPAKGLLLVGLASIFLGYWVPYSARAVHTYDRMTVLDWSRYHLLPHLGLTLFLAGGLPRWRERFGVPGDGGLTWQHARWLLAGTALLFLLQLPRPVLSLWALGMSDKQWATLRRIDVLDQACRRQRIDATTAREALANHLHIEGFSNPEHAWLFLRCSETPRPWTVEEARAQLLAASHE